MRMIFPFRARRARARVAIPRERARVNFSRDRVWVPANPRGKNTGEARARTVTLVALRAATEPVKEEAMQAIFKVLLCDVKCGCVCAGMASAATSQRFSYLDAVRFDDF